MQATSMKKETRNLWVIAAGYLVFLLLFLSHFEFNPSATINLSDRHLGNYAAPLPANLIVHHNDGFDGQNYYFMALNPSFSNIRGVAPNFLQRILYPISARVLSFSYEPLLPIALLSINFAAALLSCLLLMRLLRNHGADENLVFIWAFSVGVLLSLSCNLTELMMMCLVLSSVYFFEKDSHWLATLSLAGALLARESSITLVAAFVFFFLIHLKIKRGLQYALAIVPFVLWQIFFAFRFGTVPFYRTPQALSLPHFLTGHDVSGPGFVSMSMSNAAGLRDIPGAATSLFETLSRINQTISPWPLLAFIAVMLCIAVRDLWKERRLSLYTVLIFSQLAFMFLITPKIMLNEGVEATGRYVLCLYTISFLYFAERGRRFSRILAFLLIGSSAAYFLQRAVVPKESYTVTGTSSFPTTYMKLDQ